MIVRPHWAVGGWGFNWPGLVSAVLFWALVIVAIIALVRYLRSRQRWPGPAGYGWPGPGQPYPPAASPAEHILAERYARGDIDEEEFQRRLAVLRGGAAPPPGSAPPPPV